jgi:hypothetical protein
MKSQDIRHARKKGKNYHTGFKKYYSRVVWKKVRKIQNPNVYYLNVVAINKIQMFERTGIFF